MKLYREKRFEDPIRVIRQSVDELLEFKRLDGVHDALANLAKNFVTNGEQLAVFRNELEQLQSPM